ncbi:hypothetical protein AVEN_8938-1 [Araneus ventricosus]|uniref:Uncharacterized protein n=1 Tax=Araneus ventricosus TaxID=182803 RepID=A0A4Y2PGY5_ARAVE|nr:hypothetical protein AVEN_8938-1 [Araneus ventricosus]
MRGQYAQAANKHMMKIGSSVDYVKSGGMRNVPVTKAVEHLHATTAKFSGCVLLASRPPYSFPPHGRVSISIGTMAGATNRNSLLNESCSAAHLVGGIEERSALILVDDLRNDAYLWLFKLCPLAGTSD